ncbi:hypothetical protein L7F22_057596 [Adiantum nelumboides]|nr:hypothetical protein [Adiantum nelumboides]
MDGNKEEGSSSENRQPIPTAHEIGESSGQAEEALQVVTAVTMFKQLMENIRMDGNKEEGSISEDRQPIPTAHEIGESLGQAEEALQLAVTMFKQLMENPRFKFCQLRTQFLRKETQEQVWEGQHEWAAEKVYSLCSDLGGFFLKIAQLVGKPDLAPQAWVRRLVTLCDDAPATSFPIVKCVIEHELGSTVEDLFEEFDSNPVGSASVAQVHRARIKGAKKDVAVKVRG